jgi:hypothetical protein
MDVGVFSHQQGAVAEAAPARPEVALFFVL